MRQSRVLNYFLAFVSLWDRIAQDCCQHTAKGCKIKPDSAFVHEVHAVPSELPGRPITTLFFNYLFPLPLDWLAGLTKQTNTFSHVCSHRAILAHPHNMIFLVVSSIRSTQNLSVFSIRIHMVHCKVPYKASS